MRKLIVTAMLIGFVVAASFAITGVYSHQHGGDKTTSSNLPFAVVLCLWPTLALVPLDTSYNTTGFIALGISAVANGILYGFVAFGSALMWKYVFSLKGRRERTQGWWPHIDPEH